ncbi:helix-turn-helix domain-containing protein [Deinococcus peraridilitoris]|uniref:DNA-binding protein, excisionase family n=1 Tax=Deinococcus peraridilitoris (strain DSM 19664 / LMG 22246 / CIP 109416 / KR-200) TaxID=937777 RepID=L0A1W4_DEIPD|nr:helix-turn-helix domain-containing protein [Deinococcus peraridilitoris]AFZ67893.1 DNA-binding protein, excisionase family [Deinococcus peraridilitoris DSM 19664]
MTVQENARQHHNLTTPDATSEERKKATYTPEEARHIIGVGRNLIYKMVKMGELRAVRAGARVLIPKSALDEFLSRGH